MRRGVHAYSRDKVLLNSQLADSWTKGIKVLGGGSIKNSSAEIKSAMWCAITTFEVTSSTLENQLWWDYSNFSKHIAFQGSARGTEPQSNCAVNGDAKTLALALYLPVHVVDVCKATGKLHDWKIDPFSKLLERCHSFGQNHAEAVRNLRKRQHKEERCVRYYSA